MAQEEFDDLIANEEHEVEEEINAQRYQRVAEMRRCVPLIRVGACEPHSGVAFWNVTPKGATSRDDLQGHSLMVLNICSPHSLLHSVPCECSRAPDFRAVHCVDISVSHVRQAMYRSSAGHYAGGGHIEGSAQAVTTGHR